VDGLPSSWETFLAGKNARENQQDFERLWHDCLQEEGRIQSRNGTSKEENRALATRIRRGRRFTPQKKFFQKEKSKGSFKRKEFDMTRVKCFNCQRKGHFARVCPKIRKGNKGKYRASIAAKDESQRSEKGTRVSIVLLLLQKMSLKDQRQKGLPVIKRPGGNTT
jgi:hypothetical protein